MVLEALDRHSVVPLYFQIRRNLLEQVRCGALKSGEMIPSEEEISSQLGVSRMTARQAIKSLCDLGVAYSQRGKGTFVSAIKFEKNFRQVLSFTDEMRQRGWRPRTKPLAFTIADADNETAAALHLSRAEKVISLRRVRLANSSPMGIEWSRIPSRLCPHIFDKFDPRTSLYQTLAEEYGIHIVAADETVEAGLANAAEARLLEIPKGSPVFLFTRICYLHEGKPAEYVKSTYRADRYKIVNRLTRPKGEWRN
ncbi:MAG: GntR family transcriptional regulator [Candidatus Acidiferrales bacterium]